MPKMTLAWLLIFIVGTFGSFINPLYGTLTYLFEYYLRPALHWWGSDLPDLRWNFTISLVVTLTYFLRRDSLPKIGSARRGPAACLVGLGLLMLLVTATTAVAPTQSWDKTVGYLKMILFHGIIVGTVRSEWAFDAFVGAHMAGAGWWGLEAFRDPKREAGRLANIGSGDTLGDNAAAAHLLTVIPFIAVYLLMSKDKRLRGLALGIAPFVVNALVLCNSRGPMVGMAAMGAAALWFSKAGHRLRTVGAGVIGVVVLLFLADPEFLRRQNIGDGYGDDGSTRQRLAAWEGGTRLIADYPLGAGGSGFTELSPIYIPDVVEEMKGEKRDPHNTIVLVSSEWGLPGLALFLGYYFACYLLLRDVRNRAPEGGIWYYRSVAVQVSMIGVFVAGLFTDRLYAEAPYWMGALAVALHRLQTHKLNEMNPGEPKAEVVADRWNAVSPAAARVAVRPAIAQPLGRTSTQ
jgi:hypothetical protein